LAKALAAITEADFRARFDLERLAEEEVYPRIWEEPVEELRREYGAAFVELRQFVSDAAAWGDAIVVEMS
jgi:hypothetical protein